MHNMDQRLAFALAVLARAVALAEVRRRSRVVLNLSDVIEVLSALESHENDDEEGREADISPRSGESVSLHGHEYSPAHPDGGTRRDVHRGRSHRGSDSRVLVDARASLAGLASDCRGPNGHGGPSVGHGTTTHR